MQPAKAFLLLCCFSFALLPFEGRLSQVSGKVIPGLETHPASIVSAANRLVTIEAQYLALSRKITAVYKRVAGYYSDKGILPIPDTRWFGPRFFSINPRDRWIVAAAQHTPTD